MLRFQSPTKHILQDDFHLQGNRGYYARHLNIALSKIDHLSPSIYHSRLTTDI